MATTYHCDSCNGSMMNPTEHALVSFRWNNVQFKLIPFSDKKGVPTPDYMHICAECAFRCVTEGKLVIHCNPPEDGVNRLMKRIGE